jgi:hypothetical protein
MGSQENLNEANGDDPEADVSGAGELQQVHFLLHLQIIDTTKARTFFLHLQIVDNTKGQFTRTLDFVLRRVIQHHATHLGLILTWVAWCHKTQCNANFHCSCKQALKGVSVGADAKMKHKSAVSQSSIKCDIG